MPGPAKRGLREKMLLSLMLRGAKMNAVSYTLKCSSSLWVQFQIFRRNIFEHVFRGPLNFY